MTTEVPNLGINIGNIIVLLDEESGNLVAYRNEAGSSDLLGAFPNSGTGQIVATLFAAYLAELFPKGEITMEAAESIGNKPSLADTYKTATELREARAIAEINRLGLFGTPVEAKPQDMQSHG